jgi:hypothetical protein
MSLNWTPGAVSRQPPSRLPPAARRLAPRASRLGLWYTASALSLSLHQLPALVADSPALGSR